MLIAKKVFADSIYFIIFDKCNVAHLKLRKMIKTPVSGNLECLTTEKILHSLFISATGCELHLWEPEKLKTTLLLLESREIKADSIIRQGEGEEEEMYIIRF